MVVNGVTIVRPGVLSSEPEISNGRLRLRLIDTADQRAGLAMDVKSPQGWLPSTSRYYGDWTFVDSSVTTGPTEVRVLRVDADEAVVRWTFGRHRTGAAPDRSQAYPFSKTVWLRRGAYGYYTWIEPLVRLDPDRAYAPGMSEHEVGFGGLWGPADIVSRLGRVRTEALVRSAEFINEHPYAAEFRLDNDPLVRILVPIPPGRIYVPRFSASSFGGVFVHHIEPRPFGAFVYAAPRETAESRSDVRNAAWREAPLEMLVGTRDPRE